MVMNVRELRELLHGREYGREISFAEIDKANASGLVVMFGQDCDGGVVEVEGAVRWSLDPDAYEFLTFDEKGLLENHCDLKCPNFRLAHAAAPKIRVVSRKPWRFETKIPHEEFQIFHNDELFCVGIVFALADVSGAGRR